MSTLSVENLNLFYLILSIILAFFNIIQLFSTWKDKQSVKSLVRSWQNHIEGIKNSLLAIAMNPQHFTDIRIIFGNVQAIAQQAVALDKTMTEERFYSDKDLKKKREQQQKEFQDLLKSKQTTKTN